MLSARPCIVTNRVHFTPMAQIFLSPGNPFVNPYACGPFHAFSCYAVVGYCAYHRFFEQIDVVFHSEMMALQVDDGICYKLTRTVERYVASALYPDKLDSFRGKGVLGYKHVFRMPVSAECEDWRMLHEQKMFLRVFAVLSVMTSAWIDFCSSHASR